MCSNFAPKQTVDLPSPELFDCLICGVSVKYKREHLNKNWKVSGVKKILQKVTAGEEATRKPGSGGHNRVRYP